MGGGVGRVVGVGVGRVVGVGVGVGRVVGVGVDCVCGAEAGTAGCVAPATGVEPDDEAAPDVAVGSSPAVGVVVTIMVMLVEAGDVCPG